MANHHLINDPHMRHYIHQNVHGNFPWYENWFRQQQLLSTYKLNKFRTQGKLDVSEAEANTLNAQHMQRHWRPRRGAFTGIRASHDNPGLRRYYSSYALGGSVNYNNAKVARIRLSQRLRQHNLQLERTLGWGGNGIASLFYIDRGNGLPRDHFVAKCNIRPDPSAIVSLQREKEKTDVGSP